MTTLSQGVPTAVITSEKERALQAFETCMAAKNRMLITLGIVFFTYHFTFIIGAGWFKAFYAIPLWGYLNIGTAFALSQYLFSGVLALIYAAYMKRVDQHVQLFSTTWRALHEPR
jgi:uncharacterized membrane protein (DUF485 family)